MYSVEMKGPNDEVRVFHVNPWGHVMPFGGPGRRSSSAHRSRPGNPGEDGLRGTWWATR
jgi:hypothetical protein